MEYWYNFIKHRWSECHLFGGVVSGTLWIFKGKFLGPCWRCRFIFFKTRLQFQKFIDFLCYLRDVLFLLLKWFKRSWMRNILLLYHTILWVCNKLRSFALNIMLSMLCVVLSHWRHIMTYMETVHCLTFTVLTIWLNNGRHFDTFQL